VIDLWPFEIQSFYINTFCLMVQ